MVRIFADSTNDLGPELTARCKTTIIPLYVTIGDRTGRDGVDINPADIFEWADRTKDTPKTAAISPDDAMDAIRASVEAGDEILFFGISTEMSTTCNSVRLAAQALDAEDRVFVVDSRNLSTGIGLIILEAARMVEEGMKAADIVKELEEIIPKVRASFVIDTLVYLARGGRCTATTALLASALKIKPRIDVVDGTMGVGAKYRGKRQMVFPKYAKELEEKLLKARPDHVFVTHTATDEEAQEIKAYLESLHYFKEIHVTTAGSVISSHCGPGTLGVLYIEA
ncbi:MAG: DegV family protein [Lachnospiraceae bacterium]|nr:DegV family protein [Lachnospiraceae bacterium]